MTTSRESASAPYSRPAPRQERQTPTVPWFYLLSCIAVMAFTIMLVVKQRAQLVEEQFKLVKLRVQRAAVLKERSELKLAIQRLSNLERIDGMSRADLKMDRPVHRELLDLSHYHVSLPPTTTGSAPARTLAAHATTEEGTP